MSVTLTSDFDHPKMLIDYCAEHCKTERPLFHGTQVNDMIKLAGTPDCFVTDVDDDEWFLLVDEMDRLCQLARQRLFKRVSPSVVTSL